MELLYGAYHVHQAADNIWLVLVMTNLLGETLDSGSGKADDVVDLQAAAPELVDIACIGVEGHHVNLKLIA